MAASFRCGSGGSILSVYVIEFPFVLCARAHFFLSLRRVLYPRARAPALALVHYIHLIKSIGRIVLR